MDTNPLSELERQVLNGLRLDTLPFRTMRVFSLWQRERLYGLEAFAQNNDLEAITYFRRSVSNLASDTLEWAISERLHGIALIRVQREVEGTFALERADAVLDKFGVNAFEVG
jgi:hypothetical protein